MDDSTLELTEDEAQLIKKHFKFYRALATREREPRTDPQRHFAAMCEGRGIAETEHELAYAKHMRIMARERDDKNAGEGIPMYEIGVPRSGWCTDSDWKKMRSGNYADMKARRNS
jgi:hypothetical protein